MDGHYAASRLDHQPWRSPLDNGQQVLVAAEPPDGVTPVEVTGAPTEQESRAEHLASVRRAVWREALDIIGDHGRMRAVSIIQERIATLTPQVPR